MKSSFEMAISLEMTFEEHTEGDDEEVKRRLVVSIKGAFRL